MSTALPDAQLAKARTCLRALRRAVVSYWYATMEDATAAMIEAVTATLYVNLLDEAVFEAALGKPYEDRRARAGRVVMGLELIRNCETHASALADHLLLVDQLIGVPSAAGPTRMRAIYRWAELTDLPDDYTKITGRPTPAQVRARGEARDGYKKAVAGRPVVDTLFDALAFFETIEPRLVVAPSTRQPIYGYGELPEASPDDPSGPSANWFMARPMGLDQAEVILPDLACRPTERRSARTSAVDRALGSARKAARKVLPLAPSREIVRAIRENGRVIAYSGWTGAWDAGRRESWVERRAQVWFDVRGGYPYFVRGEDRSILVTDGGHAALQAKESPSGTDLLDSLPEGVDPPLDRSHLQLLEENVDLYLAMRNAR